MSASEIFHLFVIFLLAPAAYTYPTPPQDLKPNTLDVGSDNDFVLPSDAWSIPKTASRKHQERYSPPIQPSDLADPQLDTILLKRTIILWNTVEDEPDSQVIKEPLDKHPQDDNTSGPPPVSFIHRSGDDSLEKFDDVPPDLIHQVNELNFSDITKRQCPDDCTTCDDGGVCAGLASVESRRR